MKKLVYALFLVLLTGAVYGQSTQNYKKFNLYVLAQAGAGRLVNENAVNYNLMGSKTDLYLNYNFSKMHGVATGISYSELGGNGNAAKGYFFHDRDVLGIPLLYVHTQEYQRIKIVMGIGAQANKVVFDEYAFSNETAKNLFREWTLGGITNISFMYKISERAAIGVTYSIDGDYTKMKSANEEYFKGKQYAKYFHYTGIGLNYAF